MTGSRDDGDAERRTFSRARRQTGMTDSDAGRWVSLFSGGKDSSWALYRALTEGLDVARLLTVHPEGDSYMYHVPATHLAELAAESVGIEHVSVRPGDLGATDATDASAQGEYQTSRIRSMTDRLDCGLFAPLWERAPLELGEAMLDAGFEITIVQVAAYGLDRSWLGRTLDRDALAELADLEEAYGVHPLGEGGEFETFVTDGPHMERPIELAYESVWEGDRGHLTVTDARLA